MQRFQLGTPADSPLDSNMAGENVAISPDGSRLVRSTRGGASVLVTRRFDRLEVETIAGSEGDRIRSFHRTDSTSYLRRSRR